MAREPKKYCYTRYSTDKQDASRQITAIDEYFRKTGERKEDYIFFSDEGISGGSLISERQTKEILNDLQQGDLILVVEMSRFSRNNIDRINFIDKCDKLGVTIYDISNGGNVTLQGKDEGLLTLINSWQDSTYLTRLSRQTKEGLEAARKKGKLFGAASPKYGGGDKTKLNELRQDNAKKASLTRITKTINHPEYQERVKIFRYFLPQLNDIEVNNWDKKELKPIMYEQIYNHIKLFCGHWKENKINNRLDVGSLYVRTIKTYQKYADLVDKLKEYIK